MTFKEALQAEINLQGLSVAIIAKASGISKGAIYNILNGTTEEARIRPSTCKAIALACDRELRHEDDGVEFVEFGKDMVRVSPRSRQLTWILQGPKVGHTKLVLEC